MKNNIIKKAGLYVRTSTDNQQDSLQLQKEELRNYCHS
ncbi:MAG: recombinase family protein, partial [Desulfobacula sp.]|nr:recombinase family protein [Desulfobacula sp.]